MIKGNAPKPVRVSVAACILKTLLEAVRGDAAQMGLLRRAVLKRFLELDAKRDGEGAGPIVLVFDDLHLADGDSLDLLSYLVDAIDAPLLVVCIARPELFARRDDFRGLAKGKHTLVELAPLSEAHAAAVMSDLLAPCGDDEAVEDLVDAAATLAAGTPALLEQMVRIFKDIGVLEAQDAFAEEETWTIHAEKLAHVRLAAHDRRRDRGPHRVALAARAYAARAGRDHGRRLLGRRAPRDRPHERDGSRALGGRILGRPLRDRALPRRTAQTRLRSAPPGQHLRRRRRARLQAQPRARANTQTSFEHLFQGPGADELEVDTNRTSLTGTAATVRFGKQAAPGGKKDQVFKFETVVPLRSPELELNDIGFMLTTNEINHFTWVGLHIQKPIGTFRTMRFNYNHWSRWDYNGNFLFQLFNTNAHATFNNNWAIGAGFNWNPYEVSNNALRGAQAMRCPSGKGYWAYVNSDSRKKVQVNFQYNRFWGNASSVLSNEYNFDLLLQPMNALKLSFSASYSDYYRRGDQFVQNVKYGNMVRTIISQLDQNTLRFTARLTYNITPDLTLQYYGQPFITRPLYSKFAYVTDAMAKHNDDRYKRFTPLQISSNNGVYEIDENRDGITDYSFGNPDFNFVQFNSNLIARWEYKPGSELYLVWNQGNTPYAYGSINDALTKSLFNNAINSDSRNIFLVKWTYRFLK